MADQRKKGRELADLLNKSQSSASRRMRGETPLNLNELETVAPWLGVSISRLTGNEIPAEITAN
jgi:transcriptional regulator with XRE-family HTH domain